MLETRGATSPTPDPSPVLPDLGCTQATVPPELGVDLDLQLAVLGLDLDL